MTAALATIEASGVAIDHQAILKSLNLNPRDPNTQALLLVCERYGLDPLLKHMVLISGNPYVTRDGYLAVAHRSGVFDGMEVVDQGADETHYTAKVSVWRKDMGRPFTFIGRFPKAKSMAREYGPEMAVKVAEVQALRRAFNVTGVGAADERWDDEAVTQRAGGEPGSASAAPARANTPRPGPRQAVDVATGEVVDSGGAPSTGTRKRRPPTAPAEPATVEVVEPVEADPPPSEQQVADIRRRLERLNGQDRATVRAAWPERVGQAFLHDGELHPEFSAVHAAKALALLEDFSTLPTTDEPAPTLDAS